MYQTHFHLNDRPFASAPNPEHYFPAASSEQAREVIALTVERATGVSLLMGPVGSGKTLLCQLIANQFGKDLPVCMLPGERLRDRSVLLQAILHRLNLPYRDQSDGELRLLLSNHVTGNSCPRGILLIVDEADRLPFELLEEIRVITNLVRDGEPCVRLVLAGGPRLEERVGHPKLESLNQRVVCRLHLQNFTREETADYVGARIAACGGDVHGLFTDEALATAFQATAGVPRLINQVCDHALLMSSVGDVDQLDGMGIEEAWADLQQLPMPTRGNRGKQASGTGDDAVVEFGALDEEEADLALCIELDELHQEVSSATTDSEESAAVLEIAGDIDIEESLNVEIDGAIEIEHQTVVAGLPTDSPALEHVSADSHPAPVATGVAGQLARHEEGDRPGGPYDQTPGNSDAWSAGPADDDLPHILASPFTQKETFVEDSDEDENAHVNSDMEIEPSAETTSTEEIHEPVSTYETSSPFEDEFHDEEVVIQQFTSPSILARQDRDLVSSSYSRHLAGQLTAAHPGLRMVVAEDHARHDILSMDDRSDATYRPLSACIGTTQITEESLPMSDSNSPFYDTELEVKAIRTADFVETQQELGNGEAIDLSMEAEVPPAPEAPYAKNDAEITVAFGADEEIGFEIEEPTSALEIETVVTSDFDPRTDPVLPESTLADLSILSPVGLDSVQDLHHGESPIVSTAIPEVSLRFESTDPIHASALPSPGASSRPAAREQASPASKKRKRVFGNLFSRMRRA